MGESTVWTSEKIISDVLGCAPDMQIGGETQGWRLSRWRGVRDAYMGALVGALQAYVLRGQTAAPSGDIPVADVCAYRLHQAVGAVGVTPSEDRRHALGRMQ